MHGFDAKCYTNVQTHTQTNTRREPDRTAPRCGQNEVLNKLMVWSFFLKDFPKENIAINNDLNVVKIFLVNSTVNFRTLPLTSADPLALDDCR